MEGLVGYLPVLLVALACPLMMVLMMRGMHGGRGSQQQSCHNTPAFEPDADQVQHLEREVAQLREQLNTRMAVAAGTPSNQVNVLNSSHVSDGR